jgi:hypothetical protein
MKMSAELEEYFAQLQAKNTALYGEDWFDDFYLPVPKNLTYEQLISVLDVLTPREIAKALSQQPFEKLAPILSLLPLKTITKVFVCCLQ